MNNEMDQIYCVLKTYIDPIKYFDEDKWQFFVYGTHDYRKIVSNIIRNKHKNIVVSFRKGNRISYCLFKLQFRVWKRDNIIRSIFYVNDGLISTMFNAEDTEGYRHFAKKHLPKRKGILQRLISKLPPFFFADTRFIIFEKSQPHHIRRSAVNPVFLNELNFMMFSNIKGKLLFVKPETFKTGIGQVVKVSGNYNYVSVLEHEFNIGSCISERIGLGFNFKRSIRKLEVNNTLFVIEDYINGRSLKDVLSEHACVSENNKVIEIIVRLDAWYRYFYSGFSGKRQTITSFYTKTIEAFLAQYGKHNQALDIVKKLERSLGVIDYWHNGLVPVISHNDLWPANFIVDSQNIFAIDWERAREGSSGIFDYFWMMISTAIFYLKEKNKLSDYGSSYRLFMNNDDIVSSCVYHHLRAFLSSLGFDERHYDLFMLLFLTEWSIQGYLCLRKHTAMDNLAFCELLKFSNDML